MPFQRSPVVVVVGVVVGVVVVVLVLVLVVVVVEVVVEEVVVVVFDVSVHQYIPSPGRGDEFAGQCREQMVYSLFDPPPCPEMNPSCLQIGVRKNMFPVYVAFETLPICLPFVGSRSAGFFPSPAVRLDFRFQFASRGGESTLHLCKERKVDCFFPSQLSPVVSNISTTCSLDFGNSCALYMSIVFREICVCVCELVLDEETRWTCACTGYDALSACEPFFFRKQWVNQIPFECGTTLHNLRC